MDVFAHRKRECYYSEYICVEELANLMRNRTEILEEKLFIRVHQINEIAMQQIVLTLQALTKMFQTNGVENKLTEIDEYMSQILKLFKVQKEANSVLISMNINQFLFGFRPALGTASGIQSSQFYVIQMLLGLPKDL